ncbi:NADH-quinone oxidoreductase subunit N [Gordonia sp. HNM0687]|uniref:NADH-quinone oxidoreductase subunit N n=2 Tax=Gordonia mangrovi TaxID=2665643 RepID=A0A6L7GTL1_9ACTN|nr:NADH-quinone oxidoreductase subunit N [Gordonia mangrovi]
MRPLAMLPEILLFGGGLTVLICGSFLPRTRQWRTRLLAAVVLVSAIVVAAVAWAGGETTAFEGAFAVDTATGVVRIAAAVGALAVLALAGGEIAGSDRESETYALILFATAGTLVVAGAQDLLVLAPGFLLASIPVYGLIGLRRDGVSAEAAMKTYLLGALFGIVLLAGITLLYGVSGVTDYTELTRRLPDAPDAVVAAGLLGVTAGLLFKAGGLPAHFWVPDAAQGASATVATFVTTVPKVGALVAIYRLAQIVPDTVAWPAVLAVFAVAGMVLATLAAYWQDDPRRLLGWSTVAQVGFLLVPVVVIADSELALPALLFYLLGYTVTNVAAFAVSAARPDLRELGVFRGLARSSPLLAGSLVVALLGLVGTPPTAVFVAKLTVATSAWEGGWAWLAVAVVIVTVLSLFFYLRWLAPVFGRSTPGQSDDVPRAEPWAAATAVAAAVASVALGVLAGPVWHVLTA